MSGLPWVNGDRDQGPVPVGVSIADLLGSCHLAQGITALLVRRARTGQGGLIESSLMEGLIDLQFELMSAHLNDRDVTVERGGPHSASAFMAAPFGIYETTDGFIAIAMNPVPRLGQLIGLPELTGFIDPDGWWHDRERINATLAAHLATRSTQDWLDVLRPADVWCAPVMTLPELVDHDGFRALDIDQPVSRTGADGSRVTVHTTRSPLRIDGGTLAHERGAPHVGEHTAAIDAELGLRRNGQAER